MNVHAIRPSSPVRLAALSSALACAVFAAPAHATLVLLDDFSGGTISPSKWEGEEGKQYGSTRVEARRVVASGQLRLEAKGYSDNTFNSGSSTTRNSLIVVKSSAVNDIKATITMRTAAFVTCAGNTTSASNARARIFGFFFNAGTPTPGSEYNDVYASVQVSRLSNSTDPAGTFQVSGVIGVCTDDSCIGSNTVSTTPLGTVTLNTPTTLEVHWDPANNRFIFQKDSAAAVNVAYTLSDANPPEYAAKRIEVANVIANCTATRASAYSGADFDNVMTNALPAVVLPMTSAAHPELAPLVDAASGGAN